MVMDVVVDVVLEPEVANEMSFVPVATTRTPLPGSTTAWGLWSTRLAKGPPARGGRLLVFWLRVIYPPLGTSDVPAASTACGCVLRRLAMAVPAVGACPCILYPQIIPVKPPLNRLYVSYHV